MTCSYITNLKSLLSVIVSEKEVNEGICIVYLHFLLK